MIATKRNGVLLAAFTCFSVLLACNRSEPAPTVAVPQTPTHSYTVQGNTREMNLVQAQKEYPEHNGKNEFVNYCGICHSLQYITNQPNFTKEIWQDEIHKMVEKYKAPVPPEVGEKVLDYILFLQSQP